MEDYRAKCQVAGLLVLRMVVRLLGGNVGGAALVWPRVRCLACRGWLVAVLRAGREERATDDE